MNDIKNAVISARILSLIAAGKTVREAFNAVLGADAYEKLAGEIYDTLRARAK